jgi:hypothetical protein
MFGQRLLVRKVVIRVAVLFCSVLLGRFVTMALAMSDRNIRSILHWYALHRYFYTVGDSIHPTHHTIGVSPTINASISKSIGSTTSTYLRYLPSHFVVLKTCVECLLTLCIAMLDLNTLVLNSPYTIA